MTFGWIILAAVGAIALAAEVRVDAYDRYGLYGVGHPAGGYILGNPPDYEDKVWRRIAEAGATSCRIAASWREIEAEKGRFDWSSVEACLKYCRKYPQIRPYLLVVNTPGWARADGKPSHLPPQPQALSDWKNFCTQLARRYKGFVRHYEVWNEQNGFGWEAPPFNQVDKYLPLLEAAYDGLKEADPDCIVCFGGLDNAAGNSPIFTKGSYDLKFKGYSDRVLWDAFGDHPYGDTASMMDKLRTIKGIAAGYGDTDVEMWLTEYGFQAAHMSLEQQARELTEYMTTLILDPEFEYVTETNYLCVADFEQATRSFGLCDANLRPRPAFYAFQRLPRPGKIVISDISVQHVGPELAIVKWNTDVDASGEVTLHKEDGHSVSFFDKSPCRDHAVTVYGLRPNTAYSFKLTCRAEDMPESTSLDYELATLAESGLRNGGFEQGFEVQIAKHWLCIGQNHCWDSARLPQPFNVARSGKSAQCIIANGAWKNGLDDYVAAYAPARRGEKFTFTAWTRASSENEQGAIARRVGIDPTGGTDPTSPNITWSEWNESADQWEIQSITTQAKTDVITVFAHAKSEHRGGGRDFFYVDDARLDPAP